MDEKFYKTWFQGFEKGLEDMDSNSVSHLFSGCAKACVNTGVLEMHRNHYKNVNEDRDQYYSTLEQLGNVRGEVIIPGKEYIITFPECSCDLHTSGGVNTAKLCECSRQSILYIGKQLWKDETAKVECLGTVLSGASECRFRISFTKIKI